jgi:hypothetical protein
MALILSLFTPCVRPGRKVFFRFYYPDARQRHTLRRGQLALRHAQEA